MAERIWLAAEEPSAANQILSAIVALYSLLSLCDLLNWLTEAYSCQVDKYVDCMDYIGPSEISSYWKQLVLPILVWHVLMRKNQFMWK